MYHDHATRLVHGRHGEEDHIMDGNPSGFEYATSTQVHSYGIQDKAKDKKSAPDCESYSNWCSHKEELQFRPNHHQLEGDDDSGVCSPPLWKNSPGLSPSPPRSPSHPLLSGHNYRSISPNSRIQAITRGQRELMEMVKNMPESSYELSLKDLVEQPKIETQALQAETSSSHDNQNLHQRAVAKVKREESSKNMMRNGSFGKEGLLLKMVFPFSFDSKKKKKLAGSNSGKVSPKPEVLKGGGERDWWKRKFTGSSDSDSSRTSGDSGTSGSTVSGGSSTFSGNGGGSGRNYSGSRKRNSYTSCWKFLQFRRSK